MLHVHNYLESEFSTTIGTFEAATVEEGEVLQRAHAIHLVHHLRAPETRALVEVGAVHHGALLARSRAGRALDWTITSTATDGQH